MEIKASCTVQRFSAEVEHYWYLKNPNVSRHD